ncbi:unnamed protein product, partial [Closterium sp. NIES-53]
EDFECLAAAVPRFASMLLAPEGDPDAPDIPTPRSYAEAIMGPYSSQWQTAMDAEMASWKSTGTYVDEVPPPGANIVNGMWIFRVKRPPGSPRAFKVRYVARGFSQRQGVDYFQTFSPTPKMTTLRVLLHVADQRDYELPSLDFSTAFLQGSLHEEIWLRCPPGFTGSFPAGTQWSLRRPINSLCQAPREWNDTLRTTLAALGFAPSTADPSLFLRTDPSLLPFYVLVYVDDLVFATADTEALTLVKSGLQKRHTCTDLGPSALQLPVLLATAHSSVYLPLALSSSFGRVPRYVAPGRHRKVQWDAAKRVLCYLCTTSSMGLVLGGRGPVVLTGHADASWVDDSATQRSSQGYTFSLGSGSVSWRSTCSSSVLSSSCEAEIYAGPMAAQELRWLTYLLTDLGEQLVRLQSCTIALAYVATRANTADIFTKALPPGDHQCFPTVLVLALYDAVVARYSSPATSALGRLLLPYLFPEQSAFATVEDLVSHLRTSDARYRATLLAEFLAKNPPPIVVAVGAARGTPHMPFFEGCSPSPLAPSYASASAADVHGVADVEAASASAKHRSSKDKGGRGGGGGSGGGGGGNSGGGGGSGGGGSGGSGGGSGGFGGGGGGSSGSGGSGSLGSGGGRTGAPRGGSGGGQRQQQQHRSKTPSPQQLREWFAQCGASGGSVSCPYVIRIGDRACQTCGKLHTQHRCFSRLDDAWRAEVGDKAERLCWAELLRTGVAIFDLDFDAILAAMYALSASAEGDCYLCVPPNPGIEAAALGASECILPGSAPVEALHTFNLDSGASRCLHLPLFSTNLVSTAALQDAMVTATAPGGQRVSICTCTRMGHHLVTFTCRPGSSLYTLATKPPHVAASTQVSASGQPSLPRLCGMHSRLLVSGLPRSLPPLPPWPAPPCLLCIEEQQRVAAHSSSFPPMTVPLQTLHMDVWSPARVSGQGRERYFLLVVDDFTQYTTVFLLHCKGQVIDVLIPWIRTVRLQLRERFRRDLPVLPLHSDRGGEFSSNLLRDFCRGEGILQSFTLPDSPQQNGIAERRIGLVMEVARTSMIHAAAPHFLWPFAVRYAAHQLNLWPRVSLPETLPSLRWTGKVGDASVFRFYHPTSRRVFPSQDVTFDESVPFYRLFPYRSAPPPPPPLFLAPGPPSVDPFPPLGYCSLRCCVWGCCVGGAEPGGAGFEGAGSGGAEPGGAEPAGVEPGGAEPESVEPGGTGSEGAESGGAEPRGTASSGGPAGAPPRLSPCPEPLSPQQLCDWFAQRTRLFSGAAEAGVSAAGDTGAGGAGVTAGAGGTRGAAAAGPVFRCETVELHQGRGISLRPAGRLQVQYTLPHCAARLFSCHEGRDHCTWSRLVARYLG